jgi:hypothetical protein
MVATGNKDRDDAIPVESVELFTFCFLNRVEC